MKKFIYLSILLTLFILVSNAQEKKDSLAYLDLTKIALSNQSDSYVTFPIDIGNLDPLIFEANISPSFIIRKRKDSRLMGVLTPQIMIRMYNQDSYPIYTPSYIPQISFYYLVGDKKSKNYITFFGRIAHHSNGQNGDFYDENGNINLLSGNFATNYLEFGLINSSNSKNLNTVKNFKSSFEVHPKSWMLDEMQGIYSALRWHNTFSAFKLPRNNLEAESRPSVSLKLETTWMFDSVNNWNTFDLNRLNAGLTFYYHPKFLEDIGLFVQFYHGMDYYNIYFNHQIDTIRFGLMTEILRF
ncbi:hypothetical protein [uncultured Lutibacter sp.]|uniref:hypothetical protein n=1 Tax=uncultured Lutibacter sp. TaxID=437739 RepID=UPI0026372AD6|nr:hypothetical protein [uncultured Lutibacter sp.]